MGRGRETVVSRGGRNEKTKGFPGAEGHQKQDCFCFCARLAQLVRASHLHCEGRGFESLSAHRILNLLFAIHNGIVLLVLAPLEVQRC